MGCGASTAGPGSPSDAKLTEVRPGDKAAPASPLSPAAGASSLGGDWVACYGVIGCLSVKDMDGALALVDADAQAQIKQEARAPFFTVMGEATEPSCDDHYGAPPDALTKDKLAWLAMFDNKTACKHTSSPPLRVISRSILTGLRVITDHDGEHKTRTEKAFMPAMGAVVLTGEMSDYAGGFMGDCFYLENKNISHDERCDLCSVCAQSPLPFG